MREIVFCDFPFSSGVLQTVFASCWIILACNSTKPATLTLDLIFWCVNSVIKAHLCAPPPPIHTARVFSLLNVYNVSSQVLNTKLIKSFNKKKHDDQWPFSPSSMHALQLSLNTGWQNSEFAQVYIILACTHTVAVTRFLAFRNCHTRLHFVFLLPLRGRRWCRGLIRLSLLP